MEKQSPGFHPAFNIEKFEVQEQRTLRRLANLFYVTRYGEVKLGGLGSAYRYALAKPTGNMRGMLHTDREVMLVFSPYSNFQPRTLDAFDAIIADTPEEFRVEKVARLLISADVKVAEKIKGLFQGRPDAPVVVPFSYSELTLSTNDQDIISRIREFTFSRDLFSVSSPLRDDLYFFGRSHLINEICAKLSSGENFGLFGLRRSGKTSLISGVARALAIRKIASVTIDCQSPSVHQLRWNELLRYIAIQVKEHYAVPAQIMRQESYDERNAAASFLKDMTVMRGRLGVALVALLFDEVERISLGTASSRHWNEERDFLLFWQAVRAGFQVENSPFTFLMVGTNPSCVEKVKIFESDNPLFGNVQRRYIPMFTQAQVGEMVNSLGAIMGVTFCDEVVSRLFQDFGGHPFLTRQACSVISQYAPQRPVEVDRSLYAVGYNGFAATAGDYVKGVVDLLENQYEDEYELLKLLGHGSVSEFVAFTDHDPKLLEHLVGYGLIKMGINAPYFNIGIVENYFQSITKPPNLLTRADRHAEISRRRNKLEQQVRLLIRDVFAVSFPRDERLSKVLAKLSEKRRAKVADASFDSLLSEGMSPLYFDELKSIILGYWENFKNALGLERSEFEFFMNTINRLRVDAHAKDIEEAEFEKVRVSLNGLEKILSDR